jgi:hypothetical protein
MLYETTGRLIGKLAFKIQDARLGHTLSRDNVRRDEHFTRALQMVRTLAETELPRVIDTALRTAALEEPGKWEGVASAIIASEIGLAPARWSLPLVDEIPSGRTIDAPSVGRRMWTSGKSTPLTQALARAGVPIVRVTEYARPTFEKLRELLDAESVDVANEYVLVEPVRPTPMDQVFLDTLLAIFEACRRAPPRILLAHLLGAHMNLLAIAGGSEDAAFPARGESYVLDKDIAGSTPFTRTRRRALVINAHHALVRAARTSSDPRMAAAHLARAVLLQHQILDVEKSRVILDYTLAKVTRGPA